MWETKVTSGELRGNKTDGVEWQRRGLMEQGPKRAGVVLMNAFPGNSARKYRYVQGHF